MATITFKLSCENKRKAEQPIFARYSHKPANGKPTEFQVKTDVFVLPSQFKNGEVIKHSESVELNRQLNRIKERLQTAQRDAEAKDMEPVASVVKTQYGVLLRAIQHIDNVGGASAIDEFFDTVERGEIEELQDKVAAHKNQIKIIEAKIEHLKRARNEWVDDLLITYISRYTERKGKNTLEKATTRAYKSISNSINAFKTDLKIGDVDDVLLYAYQDWLIAKGTLNSSIENYITKIKGVLKYYAGEAQVNLLYSRYSFGLPSKQDNVIALEESDLQEIAQLTFPTKANGALTAAERSRDLLLLMCSTGLRYSDAFLKPEDVKDGMIVKILRKTKKYNISVNVPLNAISESILVKYAYEIPKLEDYYFNSLIKDVCKRLKSLHGKETVINYCGLTEVKETKPKYDLISSHSGRRSFINILVDYDVPLVNIIALTGHTNLQQLQTYADKRRNLKKRMLNVFQLQPEQNMLLTESVV